MQRSLTSYLLRMLQSDWSEWPKHSMSNTKLRTSAGVKRVIFGYEHW